VSREAAQEVAQHGRLARATGPAARTGRGIRCVATGLGLMAERVRVDLESEPEAEDLSRALAVRGLAGRPATSGGRPAVEVTCRHEETDRLLADLLPALEAWRVDRARPQLRVTAGEQVHILGSPQLAAAEPAPPEVAAA
jgi:hypothetical protein